MRVAMGLGDEAASALVIKIFYYALVIIIDLYGIRGLQGSTS
jgi:hypothetical protein